MKELLDVPRIVDLAYEIISLHEENIYLRRELEHYKEMDKINRERIDDNSKHNKEMTEIIFDAVLDPNSAINKGQEAIIKEQIRKGK